MEEYSLSRTELLIGSENIDKLKNARVVVLGIGGVGGFVVEALVRSGIGHIAIVDKDTISISNLNRQIIATHETIGKDKVEVMKERMLSINPQCRIESHKCFIDKDNIGEIIGEKCDYVVDAIDTVTSKLQVIEYCSANNIPVISSMGTGNKLNPLEFKITTIDKTKVCPLAKVMRTELKKRGITKTKVLYSEEIPVKTGLRTPGSMSFVPPVAGMAIGGQVIKDIIKLLKDSSK